MEIDFNSATYATSVTAACGTKYHPAIQRGGALGVIHYWDNITCATEQEAYDRASLALADALDAANQIVRQWHLLKL